MCKLVKLSGVGIRISLHACLSIYFSYFLNLDACDFKDRRRKFQFLAFFVVQVVFHQIVCIIFFLAFVYFDIFLILISARVVVGKGVGLGFFFPHAFQIQNE